jgi:hypothetical protein
MLHKKLHNFYSTPNISRLITSRTVTCVTYWRNRNLHSFDLESLKDIQGMEHGRTRNIKLHLTKQYVCAWIGRKVSVYGQLAKSCNTVMCRLVSQTVRNVSTEYLFRSQK